MFCFFNSFLDYNTVIKKIKPRTNNKQKLLKQVIITVKMKKKKKKKF